MERNNLIIKEKDVLAVMALFAAAVSVLCAFFAVKFSLPIF